MQLLDELQCDFLCNNYRRDYRRIRAVWSVEYLKSWLQVHPEESNPEAPLWATLNSKENLLKPLQYAAIRMKLKRIAKKAGINKRIHPHLFRHSRATYMANYLTEAQMNVYFGWTQGSDMQEYTFVYRVEM
jgi:integrase/recombinase XerD